MHRFLTQAEIDAARTAYCDKWQQADCRDRDALVERYGDKVRYDRSGLRQGWVLIVDSYEDLSEGARSVFSALAEQRSAILRRPDAMPKAAARAHLDRLIDRVEALDYWAASDVFAACRSIGRFASVAQ